MFTDRLEVVIENAAELSRAQGDGAFALIRRQGFGASDSSVLLGVNPFPDNTLEDLIQQKLSTTVTENEKKIGQMVNVRKGVDLEHIIMAKFEERYKYPVEKPEAMFRIKGTPLTVNFDGIANISEYYVPVECKFVSAYGGKHYDLSKAMPEDRLLLGADTFTEYPDLTDHIQHQAKCTGIPVYYYTQIQQQLYALGAEFGYLAALFDKDWELRVFKVSRDVRTQQALIDIATREWDRIQRIKNV